MVQFKRNEPVKLVSMAGICVARGALAPNPFPNLTNIKSAKIHQRRIFRYRHEINRLNSLLYTPYYKNKINFTDNTINVQWAVLSLQSALSDNLWMERKVRLRVTLTLS
jgi:hypothetical protein